MKLELHGRQSRAFHSPASEILFGGAAGGGKSHLLRVVALAWAVAISGLQVYLFRRTSPDLARNHMSGPTGFPALLADWIERGHASINHSRGHIDIGDSRIHLAHCQYEKDVYKYQGAEIHVLLMDELTHFTQTQYVFLRSRVRMTGLDLPPEFEGRFPRIVAGSNPGGVGHNWVKAMFVDPRPPMEIWRAPDDEGGMLRQFVPSRLEDNPSLMESDPDYHRRLEGLGNPALVRAMKLGDWDIVAGGMFDDLWTPAVHVVPRFQVPSGWRIDRAFDWGSSRPFATGWFAEVTDGFHDLMPGHRCPRGSMFLIDEWYGWDGRTPNVGIKATDAQIARGIVEREKAMGIRGRVRAGPADSAIFTMDAEGRSIASTMAAEGATFTESLKGPGSRKRGWQGVRTLLEAARSHDPELPHLHVFDHCRQFIRTVPTLPRDDRDPDDVDTDAEDHMGDMLRYRIHRVRRSGRAEAFHI